MGIGKPSSDTLPTISRPSGSKSSDLWLRINAFLSLKSANTQTTYTGIIAEWCRFLGSEPGSADGAKRISQATDLHAMAYRKYLEGRPGEQPRLMKRRSAPQSTNRALATSSGPRIERRDGLQSTQSNATIAKKFAALRRLYRMLLASNLGVRENPFDVDKVPPPSAKSGQKRPTEMVAFDMVKKVLNAPPPTSGKGVRDRALLAVLFGGGLRRSEAAGLRIGDVRKTAKGTVFLRLRATKGKKDSDQPLPSWAVKYVKDLIGQRVQEKGGAGDYLFISYRGRGGLIPTPHPLSHNGIYRLFKEYCKKAGAGDFLTPHSARATAITRLLDSGVPHREVQEFSRHSSVQMVEVYDKRRIGVDENVGRELEYE